MSKQADWSEVWQELQQVLKNQPRCPKHPQYPCVKTLSEKVVNDIIEVSDQGIKVRSHRTNTEDTLAASQFETWWHYLVSNKSASLKPESAPHADRSRLVGAILVTCLPNRIRTSDNSTITLS